ncbi:Polynucleotide 5'-hydroxyl-kinase grc3 [Agyrium rufum]|nr:Polynucleotide 5'-hydroxyl-kinase grc3 [Agyrium rufum]
MSSAIGTAPKSAFAARKAFQPASGGNNALPLSPTVQEQKQSRSVVSSNVNGDLPPKRLKRKRRVSTSPPSRKAKATGANAVCLPSEAPLLRRSSQPSEQRIRDLPNEDRLAQATSLIPDLLGRSYEQISDVGNSSDSGSEAIPTSPGRALSNFRPTPQNVVSDSLEWWRIRLQDGEYITLIGTYSLWVLKGAVNVSGATVHASSQSHCIYAPSSHSLPVIRHSRDPFRPDSQPVEICISSQSDGLRPLRGLSAKFRKLWGHPATARKRGSTAYPASERSFQFLANSRDDPHLRSLHALSVQADWKERIDRVVNDESQPNPIVLVCGAKGVGKSTFSRFLINTFLSRSQFDGTNTRKRVFLLDLDPGQPEYSPPGEISLIQMAAPNLSTPAAHPSLEPKGANILIKAHHIGATSPKDDPLHYINCALDLIAQCRRLASLEGEAPIIINTSGWIKGSGLEILLELIQNIRPQHVCLFGSGDGLAIKSIKQCTRSLDCTQHVLPQFQAGTGKSSRSPADLRQMQQMSYFHLDSLTGGELSWNSEPLYFSEPYMLTYLGDQRDIFGVMVLGEEIDMECIADLIDGSVLGMVLVHDETALEEPNRLGLYGPDQRRAIMTDSDLDDEPTFDDSGTAGIPTKVGGADMFDHDWIKRTPEDLPYMFHGIGNCIPLDPLKSSSLGQVLVRGIDTASKTLHIYTPIPRETIDQCLATDKKIVLVRGKLDIPAWAYQEECAAALAKKQRAQRRNETRATKREKDCDRRSADAVAGKAAAEGDQQGTEWVNDDDDDEEIDFDLAEWATNMPWLRVVDDGEDFRADEKMMKMRKRQRLRT